MRSIRLEGNTSCEYICSVVQSMINNYSKNPHNGDLVLVIDIKQIIESPEHQPKLEHHNEIQG